MSCTQHTCLAGRGSMPGRYWYRVRQHARPVPVPGKAACQAGTGTGRCSIPGQYWYRARQQARPVLVPGEAACQAGTGTGRGRRLALPGRHNYWAYLPTSRAVCFLRRCQQPDSQTVCRQCSLWALRDPTLNCEGNDVQKWDSYGLQVLCLAANGLGDTYYEQEIALITRALHPCLHKGWRKGGGHL